MINSYVFCLGFINFVTKQSVAYKMSNIKDVVSTLESQIHQMLTKQRSLEQQNQTLSKQLQQQQQRIVSQAQQIADWENEYNTLKMANAMLGSNENKRETKLKINTLIREIDLCIGELSK